MPQMTPARTKVFISYSSSDKDYLAELQHHLTFLKHHGMKDVFWADTQIEPGAVWRDEIGKALATARIAIFLVSPTFLSSEFIRLNELPPLLKAAKARHTLIFSVILHPSLFKYSPLAGYQTINDPDIPLAQLSLVERNKVWVKVAERVMEALKNQLNSGRPPAPKTKWTSKNQPNSGRLPIPNTREQWITEGITHRIARRYEKALTAFDRAFALTSNEASPLFGKGNVLWDMRRSEEARTLYEQAFRLTTRSASGFYLKGIALGNLQRYTESLEAYERALELDSKYVYAWSARGAVLCDLQRYSEALASVERALQMDPKYVNAWNTKNFVLCGLKRYTEALTAAERAIQLDSSNSLAYRRKSVALAGLIEQHEEALGVADRAIKLNPYDTAPYQQKNVALSMLKRYEEELALTEQLVEFEPGELVYLVRGNDNGREAWHYVLVDKSKLHFFKQKMKTGSVDVAEFGKVIYSGWGKDPPAEIIEAINKQFIKTQK